MPPPPTLSSDDGPGVWVGGIQCGRGQSPPPGGGTISHFLTIYITDLSIFVFAYMWVCFQLAQITPVSMGSFGSGQADGCALVGWNVGRTHAHARLAKCGLCKSFNSRFLCSCVGEQIVEGESVFRLC